MKYKLHAIPTVRAEAEPLVRPRGLPLGAGTPYQIWWIEEELKLWIRTRYHGVDMQLSYPLGHMCS